MSPSEERFSLTPWRGQWAHLPLVFAPFALVLLLTFAGVWLNKAGAPTAGMVVSAIGGLVFFLGVLALPTLWRLFRARGGLVLCLSRGQATLTGPDGVAVRVTTLAPGDVRRGVFTYRVNLRYGGGVFRAPLVTIPFPERPLTIGGEGVTEPPEDAPFTPKPKYRLPAHDWERLMDALGLGAAPWREKQAASE